MKRILVFTFFLVNYISVCSQDLIPYRDKNNLWGYCDKDMKIVIPCQYKDDNRVYLPSIDYNEKIESFYFEKIFVNGVAIIRINKKAGCIDETGKVIIPCVYDNINNQEKWIFVKVNRGGDIKTGLFNKDGKLIVPCDYESILPLSDTRFIVGKSNHSIIIDNDNREISKKYEKIKEANEKFVFVKDNGKWGMIDLDGKQLQPCLYEVYNLYETQVIPLQLNGKWGLVDYTGKLLSPFKYDSIDGLSTIEENEIGIKTTEYPGWKVKYKNKWGTISNEGKVVVPLKYDDVENFCEGFLSVRKKYKWGLLNEKGETIVPCKFYEISKFKNGYVIVSNNVFYNTKGDKIIAQGKYDKIENFKNGVAKVSYNGKWGLINTKGEETVPCWYDWINEFINGLAVVSKDGLDGYIDISGKEVIPCIYNEAGPFYEGLAEIKVEDKYGFMNKDGKIIVPAIYHSVRNFQNGMALVMTEDESLGIIDINGKEIIPCHYRSLPLPGNDYYNIEFDQYGLLYLGTIDKSGLFFDRSGNVVTDKEKINRSLYFNSNYYIGNFSQIKENEMTGIVNKQGKKVIPTNYQIIYKKNSSDYFNEGLVLVKINNEIGFVDTLGNEYWEKRVYSDDYFFKGPHSTKSYLLIAADILGDDWPLGATIKFMEASQLLDEEYHTRQDFISDLWKIACIQFSQMPESTAIKLKRIIY